MTANALLILLAMWLQGAIALSLLWVMGSIRLPLVTGGKIKIADIALSRDPWPEREKRVSNAFDNQFQLPVLFFVAAGVALFLVPNLIEVVLAWLFVLSRVAHAAIHASTNNVSGASGPIHSATLS
ncbi:MAG: MAPEG family protein [Devosia sp.]